MRGMSEGLRDCRRRENLLLDTWKKKSNRNVQEKDEKGCRDKEE